MKICLITYDTSHVKTAEVFWGLHNRKEFKIEFLLAPFSKRPKRDTLIQHRPDQFTGLNVRSIANKYKLRIWEYEDRQKALEADYLIVCGANILEPEFANSNKIINGHAGLIPASRGLDAFKWALLDNKLLGNTLHIINEETDSGKILHQIKTPVFEDDTISSLAKRHYKNEIWLLQNFDRFIDAKFQPKVEPAEPKKRMAKLTEQKVLNNFGDYKKLFANN